MLQKVLVLTVAAFSLNGFAAELIIDKPISVLALNGSAFSEREVDLEPGTHQLIARYSHQLADKGNKKKRIQSEVKVFEIVVTNEENIKLNAPRYNRYSQAEYAFANDKIEWILQDQSGAAIEFTTDFIPGRPGLLPYSDIERVVEDYNKKHSIVVDEVKGILTENSQLLVASDSIASGSPTLESTKHHYLQLSDEDKKAFKRWLVDVD
jgi:uncharacterized protein YccT (UPF0319 family)